MFESCDKTLTNTLNIKSEIDIKDEPLDAHEEYSVEDNIKFKSIKDEPLDDVEDDIKFKSVNHQKERNFGAKKRGIDSPAPISSRIGSGTPKITELKNEERKEEGNKVKDFKSRIRIKLHAKFECSLCEYKTNLKGNFKSHSLMNSTVKLFKCSHCDYEGNHKINLKNHLLSHSNTKLFKCSECDYESNRKGNLKVHLLSHSNNYVRMEEISKFLSGLDIDMLEFKEIFDAIKYAENITKCREEIGKLEDHGFPKDFDWNSVFAPRQDVRYSFQQDAVSTPEQSERGGVKQKTTVRPSIFDQSNIATPPSLPRTDKNESVPKSSPILPSKNPKKKISVSNEDIMRELDQIKREQMLQQGQLAELRLTQAAMLNLLQEVLEYFKEPAKQCTPMRFIPTMPSVPQDESVMDSFIVHEEETQDITASPERLFYD